MTYSSLIRSVVLGIGAFAATGCLPSGTMLTQQRAAFDLSCPASQIHVTMLSGMAENGTGSVFGAEGCGKKASYIRQDAAGVTLNSPIQEVK
jgi:hypothetical protein